MATDRPPRLRSFALSIFVLVLLASLPRGAAAQPQPYIFVPSQHWLTFIDPVTQSVLESVDVQAYFNYVAAPSPDGRRVYVVDPNNPHFRVFDVATRTHLTSVPLNYQPFDAVVTPDGSEVLVANWQNRRLDVFDTTTNNVVATIPVELRPTSLALTADGQRVLAIGQESATLKIIDIASRTVVNSIALAGIGEDVVVHPNGQTAYVALYTSQKLAVVNLASLTQQTLVSFDEFPYAIALSPDASELYVAERRGCCLTNGAIKVFSTASNTVTATIAGTGFPSGITFTADGSQAYASQLNGVSTVSAIDTAQRVVTTNITIEPYPSHLASGPPIIRGDCCAPTTIASDADLTAMHIGDYVPFLQGTLKLTGDWTTNRTISLLSDGATRTEGIIDTDGHTVHFNGPVIGEGTLVKRGDGRMWLSANATHTGGTRIERGTADIDGHHPGALTLAGHATLEGSGTIGAIHAPAGIVSISFDVLHAGQVTLGPGATVTALVRSVSNTNRLAVTGSAALNGAGLLLFFGPESLPPGEAVTLVERATGRFHGKPEGWTTVSPSGQLLRLTYRGGSGSDVVLMAEGPPTLGALSSQTIVQNTALGPLTLAVGDDFTSPGALTIAATSSNQALVPDTQLQVGNSGGVRTLTVTPLFDASGQTTITVTVTDEAALTVQRTFVLTVISTRSYYLAEGATGGFFSTDILLANPNATPAPIVITFSKDDGTSVTRQMTLPATSRTTLRANEIEGLEASAFSTTVVSTDGVPLVVERTMWWDASGYGASTEKAGTEGATTWYFAEGSQGYFHTYFLLFNPNITATVAHVTYLMEGGEAIQRDYPVPAGTRVTVDAGEQPELMHRSFGARIVFDHPALAERAMYFGETPLYTGGAAAAGVTAPATAWYLAEGATGSLFDTYVLIANPNDTPANLTITYLPDSGQPIEKKQALAGNQRLTLNIAEQDAALANAAVGTRIESDQPVVVERSQYWPHGDWYESHASAGQTATALHWGLAEGRVGGTSDAQTFILIANPGAAAAEITATFLRADGTTLIENFTVQPTSRLTVAVTGDAASHVPELTNESFATIIASTQPVIVERSLYTNSGGVIFTAGTSSTGTRLDP